MASRKQEISEETRRRLVEAAFELAADGGAAAMSIQAVATRSGISRGSVAWHFGSKDGLMVAVIEEAFGRALRFLRRRLDAEPRGAEALTKANSALMSSPDARIFSTLLLEAITRESVVEETYAAQYGALRQLYADYLREVVPGLTGVLDPDTLAVTVLGVTLGINVQHRLDPAVDREGAAHAMEAIYRAALAPAEEATA